ncbi:hypothetical protein AJ87_45990 [Rhizobium yanglingense]|nr:hypothetical protein AJ87_45990 [Rhizobium yanglingense]
MPSAAHRKQSTSRSERIKSGLWVGAVVLWRRAWIKCRRGGCAHRVDVATSRCIAGWTKLNKVTEQACVVRGNDIEMKITALGSK